MLPGHCQYIIIFTRSLLKKNSSVWFNYKATVQLQQFRAKISRLIERHWLMVLRNYHQIKRYCYATDLLIPTHRLWEYTISPVLMLGIMHNKLFTSDTIRVLFPTGDSVFMISSFVTQIHEHNVRFHWLNSKWQLPWNFTFIFLFVSRQIWKLSS